MARRNFAAPPTNVQNVEQGDQGGIHRWEGRVENDRQASGTRPAPDSTQWRSIPSILAGLAWVAAYGVLFLAATIASAMALHRLAPGAPKWLFPVSHGVLWIAGVLLVTWLVRVRLNRA